ncbi:HD domain-containing protein [Myxococcota bacterium]|nr:HD domain-containing protein [Myxococcota bacterium]
MGVRRSAAQSRFGLRMIAVFAACALLPILVFSTFAYVRTREQLEGHAVQALRRETKDVSMRLIERMTVAADQLRHVAEHAEPPQHPEHADGTDHADQAEHESTRDTGDTLFVSIDRRPVAELGLGPNQLRDLDQGAPILIDDASDRSQPLRVVRRSTKDEVVVGALRFDSLLSPERNHATQRYWIERVDGAVLSAADADGQTAAILAASPDRAVRVRLELDGPAGREMAMVWPVFLRGQLDHEGLRVGTSIPRDVILAPLDDFERAFLVAIALGLLGSLAIALHQIRRRIEPLDELIRLARAVESGDYEARAIVRSDDEFDDVARAFNAMTSEVAGHVDNLRRLTRAGSEMLRDPSRRAVSDHLVRQAVEITGADLGVLFRNESVDGMDEPVTRVVGAVRRDGEAVWPEELVGFSFAEQGAVSGTPLILQRDPHQPEHRQAWDGLERVVAARIEGILILPLRTGPGPITTQLVLATSLPPSDALFSGRSYNAVRILADQAAVAIRVSDLVANLRGLFEGVIQLTVQAIDEKSPYTGDHCRRVPILTEMIADAVDRSETGALKDFTLTPEERYELRIAALLHDCGKVATPVHVMDKATKLETIMDRVEVVRDRAEILRRDLELERLRTRIESLGESADLDDWALREAFEELEADITFVEKCNAGAEFMDPKARERIDAIDARYAWRDRSGAVQRLLTDSDRENLKIGRGTLNPEERAVIEGHVSTTIRLLESLPFPSEMARVPYIAGAHHEHIDGSGYPKGLAHDELDIQARILGLADVFEALTAKDRPYKDGRTLSQTLRILDTMVADGHIDGELHAIMLREKVHLQYAMQHMAPEQIDGEHREELERLTAPWSETRGASTAADSGTSSLDG